MRVDDCYQLGEVKKTRGFKGEVVSYLDVDFPEDYKNLESVLLQIGGKLIPFFISAIEIKDKNAHIRFVDVDTKPDAEELIGSALYLPLDSLPDLGEKGYYFHELIGFEVHHEGRVLGNITAVIDHEINPLLSLDCEGSEVLIPLQDEFVTRVDKKNKRVFVSLPEGFLDIYLARS